MIKRYVTIERMVVKKESKPEERLVSDLALFPDYCPLNPEGQTAIPNPNCYEVEMDRNETSICCFYDGMVEDENELYVKCLYPMDKKIEDIEYERREYTMVRKHND